MTPSRRARRRIGSRSSAPSTTEATAPRKARHAPPPRPGRPGFWPHVTASREFRDGAPDPLDRWSRRVIGRWPATSAPRRSSPSRARHGTPSSPGPNAPAAPGKAPLAFSSTTGGPHGLLPRRDGAESTDRPARSRAAPPCATCAAPCLTACPVGALSPTGYDTAACHGYLDTVPGADCMDRGCAVRRACPVSQSYGRLPEQSAFHMRRFHPLTIGPGRERFHDPHPDPDPPREIRLGRSHARRSRPPVEPARPAQRAAHRGVAGRWASVPDAVLCSTALRTRQTWEGIAAALPTRRSPSSAMASTMRRPTTC
jgi:epoxyqueuosine reductase